MSKILRLISLTALLISAWGCTKEMFNDEQYEYSSGDNTTLALSFRLPVVPYATSNESTMSSLRLIVFSANANGSAINAPIINKLYAPAAETFDVTEIVPVGPLTICLIANEMGSDDFGNIDSYAALESRRWNYVSNRAAYLADPFPMFSVYSGVRIDNNGKVTVNGVDAPVSNGRTVFGVERAVVKVKLNITCNFADLGDVPIKLTKAVVHSTPTHPWVLSKGYVDNGNALTDDFVSLDEVAIANDAFENVGNPVVTGFKSATDKELVFYLPEYIVTNISNYTYIELAGELVKSPSIKVVYKLPLGNGLGDGTGETYKPADLIDISRNIHPSYYSLTRNKEYDIKLNIVNLGTLNALEVKQIVKPWTPIAVDGTIAVPYLNVSTVSASIDDAAIQRVYFWTNQPRSGITIKSRGKFGVSNGTEFDVDDFFDNLIGVNPSNISYNESTGFGYFDIKSNRHSTRRYLLYLTAGNLTREIAVDAKAPTISPISWGEAPWVGTFHRNDQTGERVIFAANFGAWSAEVENTFMNGNFVKLAWGNSSDPNIKTTSPNLNAEMYQVPGNATTVSGIGRIAFRVGLSSTIASDKNRFARIKITTTSGTRFMYVRQGSEPVPLADGTNVSWTVYNIGNYANAQEFGIGTNGYVAYPTQSGYFLQFENSSLMYPPKHADRATWPGGGVMIFNVCPAGYRIPTANSTNVFGPANEMAGLGFGTAKIAGANTTNNWGCYADGYFDRYVAEWMGDRNYAVNESETIVGYMGAIVANENSGASIFFPAAGYLNDAGGTYDRAGIIATYWSSTQKAISSSYSMDFYENSAKQVENKHGYAFTIRCIK